ncbi:trafficking protein particle complex subunit 10 [Zychaea mexicana]|uniref:trafficking protein particle complex subunit 10 n=1 Tax=Zychaea mexicana TaxID=64656 RepID=UPI0022FE10D6|nr:trafficking protein particle complex subunit 10 [Zychaea mexicana]KAI9499327.1 trafficking protein particle complex subunit 10 [Zychaea mexicana]
MNGRKVTVTYCDEFDVWPLVANDLSSRLPLRNLQWHPSSQRSERFIPSLEVDLQRFNFDQVPLPLLAAHTTYLNLYFVNCDDNDAYKNKVKKQIKTWVDLIGTKKNQEWLIVYVAGQDTKRSNNYLGLKTTVFDKIRADFSQGKRDRCAYIRIVDPDGPSSELWGGFIEKMKESILASFDMQVLQIQEDARRLDLQRNMPGWNYCTFFILKEGLAQAFEIMSLYEDALIQYDELEASFFQVLRDKALAWFGHFGATDPGDDCGNIMDFKRKDYRELINKNVISVFDFRCYLFARQTRMLLKLQRTIEICKRGQLFISSFIPAIRENEDVLVDNFVESWVFSACMNIVNECEPLSTNLSAADPNFIALYSAVKADLLLTARRQLDKLGIKHKHLPVTEPFSIFLDTKLNDDTAKSPPAKPKGPMTNEKLLEAINSVEAFDKMYMALSTRAIKSYDACHRPKAALTVHGDIAALKYTRDKLDEAVRIYESMIWRYDEQEWGSIENSLLIKCADSQQRLGKTDQYIESLLTLLKNAKWLSKDEATRYMEDLLSNVHKLDSDIRRAFSPMFGITVVSIIDEQSTVESSSVEICIENHLPKSLHCDNLCLRLVGNDPEQVWFDTKDLDLAPGKNKIYLTSKTSTSGNYVVEACEMHVGKLVFMHNFMKDGQKKRILRLNHDMNRLQATVCQPDQICLGERQQLAVRISTGKKHITGGKVLLEPQMEGFALLKTEKVSATLRGCEDEEDAPRTLELDMLESGEIVLPECEPNQTLGLLVEYEGSYTEFEYRIKTTITYESEGNTREFVSAHSIHVTVPLVVTETSIFRETCVFLKVDVSCNGDHPVRILESKLFPSKSYVVESSSAVEQWDLTLFPKQVATFVYKLVKRDDVDHDLKPKVRFYAKYHTLKDEVEASIGAMLERKLQKHHASQHFTYVFSKVKEAFLSSIDYVSYGLTDVVHLEDFDAELCESFLLNRDLKTKVELLDLIEEFFEEHEAITVRTIKDNSPKPRTNAIIFPLEVPISKVLHTAELVLTNPAKELLVSERCPCTLRIKQSADWSTAEMNGAGPSHNEFYYDIDVDYDNWLLSGKRRLRFTSKPGHVFEFPVDLVPLKTGNLLLPCVRVSANSANISAATFYVNSAQQILVRAKSKTATFFVEQQQRFLQPQNTTAYAPDISTPS